MTTTGAISVLLTSAEAEALVLIAQKTRMVTTADGETIYVPTPQAEVALTTLIQRYEPLFQALVKRYANRLDHDDAHSEVVLAFIEFVRAKYLPGVHAGFSKMIKTHCTFAILDAESTGGMVSVKQKAAFEYHRFMKLAGDDFDEALAMAVEAGMEKDTFVRIHYAQRTESLDVLLDSSDDDGPRVSARREYVAVDPSRTPDQIAEENDLVNFAFSCIETRDETILRLRYGFTDDESERLRAEAGYRSAEVEPVMSDREVASALQPRSTEPTVNRHRLAAFRTIRSAFASADAQAESA